MNINSYKQENKIKIPINNKRHLLLEFIKTKDEFGNYLKITTLDEKDNTEKSTYINEGDIVLLYNYYLYQRDNNKPIF